MNKEFHPDESERRSTVISKVRGIIGMREIGEILLDGDTRGAIEPIPEGQLRDDLEDELSDESNGEFDEDPVYEAIHGTNAVDDLENWLLTGEQERIQIRQEHGTDYATAVENSMNRLPGWIAEDLLQSEIDQAENSSFTRPEDYGKLLTLQQIKAEWFGEQQNVQERKQLWDELLKFSKYRVEVTFENGSKEITGHWCRNDATAHNNALPRDDSRGAGLENVEVTVEQLYSPDTDPLRDLEAWVWRL